MEQEPRILRLDSMDEVKRSLSDDFEDFYNGTAVIMLPDGTIWGMLGSTGSGYPLKSLTHMPINLLISNIRSVINDPTAIEELLTKYEAGGLNSETVDRVRELRERHLGRLHRDQVPLPDLFIDIRTVDPARVWCTECRWVNLITNTKLQDA